MLDKTYVQDQCEKTLTLIPKEPEELCKALHSMRGLINAQILRRYTTGVFHRRWTQNPKETVSQAMESLFKLNVFQSPQKIVGDIEPWINELQERFYPYEYKLFTSKDDLEDYSRQMAFLLKLVEKTTVLELEEFANIKFPYPLFISNRRDVSSSVNTLDFLAGKSMEQTVQASAEPVKIERIKAQYSTNQEVLSLDDICEAVRILEPLNGIITREMLRFLASGNYVSKWSSELVNVREEICQMFGTAMFNNKGTTKPDATEVRKQLTDLFSDTECDIHMNANTAHRTMEQYKELVKLFPAVKSVAELECFANVKLPLIAYIGTEDLRACPIVDKHYICIWANK